MIVTYNGQKYFVHDDMAAKLTKYDRIADVIRESSPYMHNRETCDEIRGIVDSNPGDIRRTNLDLIRNASAENLALMVMCPYDTVEDVPFSELPCEKNPKASSPAACHRCLIEWLKQEPSQQSLKMFLEGSDRIE